MIMIMTVIMGAATFMSPIMFTGITIMGNSTTTERSRLVWG